MAILWRAPLASIAFPVRHRNKQIPETAFSREENSILTVTKVALMIFIDFRTESCRWAWSNVVGALPLVGLLKVIPGLGSGLYFWA